MRATRAFVASLGASLSLLVAGSLALMTVSTVVAFQGWPGIDSAQSFGHTGTLMAAASSHDAARSAQGDAIVLPRVAKAKRTSAERQPGSQSTSHAPAPRVTARAVTATRVQTRPATVAQVRPTGQTAAAPKPKVTPQAGDPVRKVGTSLGGTVQGTGQTLNRVLDDVSPGLGKAVESVTNLVAGLVDGTSQVLGKTLDALAQPPQR